MLFVEGCSRCISVTFFLCLLMRCVVYWLFMSECLLCDGCYLLYIMCCVLRVVYYSCCCSYALTYIRCSLCGVCVAGCVLYYIRCILIGIYVLPFVVYCCGTLCIPCRVPFVFRCVWTMCALYVVLYLPCILFMYAIWFICIRCLGTLCLSFDICRVLFVVCCVSFTSYFTFVAVLYALRDICC